MESRGITAPVTAMWLLGLIGIAALCLAGFAVYQAYLVPVPAEYATSFEHAYVNVTDSITGDPVEGATVKLSDAVIRSGTTDSDGVADFTGLPAGTYKVEIENTLYYNFERTGQSFQELVAKTYTSKAYSITRVGTFVVDNGDENFVSAAPRSFDNTLENRLVEFMIGVWNTTQDSLCTGTVLAIEITENVSQLNFENIECTSGQALTTVDAGEEYTISLGDLSYNSKTTITLKVGVSNADVSGYTLPITVEADDTPAVAEDDGASEVSANFTLTVS